MVMGYACAALLHANDPIQLFCHCRFSRRWKLHPLNVWDAACRTKLFVEFLCPNCSANYKWWVLLLGTFLLVEVVILQRLLNLLSYTLLFLTRCNFLVIM